MTDPCLCFLVFIAVRSCLFASFPSSFRAPGGTSKLIPTAGATWVGEAARHHQHLVTWYSPTFCCPRKHLMKTGESESLSRRICKPV